MRVMRLLLISVALPLGADEMILADFPAGVQQAGGWVWEYFSDRVMGGRSDLVPPVIEGSAGDRFLRLAGTVNTKGGGFIQVRLRRERGSLDTSPWSGVEAVVEAVAGGAYFVHLRTSQTRMPWSYFGAPLEWPGGKVTLRIPWSAFVGVSMGNGVVRPQTLRSVAIVAAERDFRADLRIYRLSLYR